MGRHDTLLAGLGLCRNKIGATRDLDGYGFLPGVVLPDVDRRPDWGCSRRRWLVSECGAVSGVVAGGAVLFAAEEAVVADGAACGRVVVRLGCPLARFPREMLVGTGTVDSALMGNDLQSVLLGDCRDTRCCPRFEKRVV